MKNNILYKFILVGIVAVLAASCEKEGDSYNLSKVTVFPTIDFQPLVAVELDGTFTPTADAKEGDITLEVSIQEDVDPGTVGVYTVTYSAENAEGYSLQSDQTVVVFEPSIVPTDVAGNIRDMNRNDRTGVITLVEGTTNIFHCTDMGFGGVFPLYFQMEGDVMTVIPQPFIFGVTSVDANYDPVKREFSVVFYPQEFDYNFEYIN